MTAQRILVLGSYPVVNPRHGGQLRLSNIVQAYRSRGFEVRQASFFPANPFYTDHPLGAADVPLPPAGLQSWKGHAAPLIEDLASGEAVAQDEARLAALERFAGPVDWIHLEQPWLLPVVQRLRERGALGAFRLIYGSQNIETHLKQAIFAQYKVRNGQPLLDGILALEQQSAAQADLVATVTQQDRAHTLGWTQAPIVLAPNGVSAWTSTPTDRDHWRQVLGPEPFALYVASAHPPNVSGFCESFGECMAALSPVQKVVLAGSVTEHILSSAWYAHWGPLNARRIHPAGVLSDAQLSALRDLAHTFVLPMTSGGGSNLKTAEALHSGRHVVATPHAMRGFEAMADLPGVVVTQPGIPFAQAVATSLLQPQPGADAASLARRATLTWSHTLAALCDAIEAHPRKP